MPTASNGNDTESFLVKITYQFWDALGGIDTAIVNGSAQTGDVFFNGEDAFFGSVLRMLITLL
jgi:hypothetical protein